MATGLVGQHQISTFVSPVNGTTPIDANSVRGNDNTIKTTYDAHDNDATIHFQSSTLAARPVASTAGQKWMTSDGFRIYYDDGSSWNEAAYLPTAGGTVSGNVTITGTLTQTGLATFDGGATIASGQTLTVTGATITGLTAASVGAGTFASGDFVFQGNVTLASTKKLSLSATCWITEISAGNLQFHAGENYLVLTNGKGLLYNGSTSTNMSDGNIAIGDSAAPTGNPASGTFFLWSDSTSHAFKGRGTSGTVTTIAAAEPHCPDCGRDFVLEWENERYGTLRICMWCLTDGRKGKRHVHRRTARGAAAHLKPLRGLGWNRAAA